MSNQGLKSSPTLRYTGVKAGNPPNYIIQRRDPTVRDYFNFKLGDIWLNEGTTAAPLNRVWMLVRQFNHVATWIMFISGNGPLISLTGNSGGAVFGDVNNNINTRGDGIGINVVGTPGTNTLLWSLVGGGQAAQSFVASSPVATPTVVGGTATPIAGVINVQAAHNISVSAGTPNTGAINDIVYWGTNVINLGDLAPANTLITGISTTNNIAPAAIDLFKNINGGAVTNTTILAQYSMYGFDGTNNIMAAAILGAVQPGSTVAANRVAGNLQFFTHPDSAAGITQRFSITSDGTSAFLAPDAAAVNATVTVGNSGTNTSLNLNRTYNVPPPGPTTDILIIDSNGFVGSGGSFVTNTFTPTLTFSGAAGAVVYVSQGGKYTRIGNIVFFDATVAVSALGGATGNMRISNLPFTIATLVNTAQDASLDISGAITLTAGYTNVWGAGIATTTSFGLFQGGSGVNSANITEANVTLGGGTPNFTVTLSGFYFTS